MAEHDDRGPVPRWVAVVTVAAVSLVAAVAAVVSYVHMHQLSERAGEDWRSVLTPLSVDGLLVAASMVMFVRRREGQSAGILPWVGLLLGLAASLAANVAAGVPDWDPPWLPGVVAAWPPVALAVAFELLILINRGHQADAHGSPAGLQPKYEDLEEQEDVLAQLVAEGAGRQRAARELGVTEWEARKLMNAHRRGQESTG